MRPGALAAKVCVVAIAAVLVGPALMRSGAQQDEPSREPVKPKVNFVVVSTTTTSPHVWIEPQPVDGHQVADVDVLLIQQRLQELGYNVWPDGVYGPQTEAAVREFQRDNRLFVDGIVGPVTTKALGLEGVLGYHKIGGAG